MSVEERIDRVLQRIQSLSTRVKSIKKSKEPAIAAESTAATGSFNGFNNKDMNITENVGDN